MVDKMQEKVTNWSKNPDEVGKRESEISMSKQAGELVEKLDKLYRTAKSSDRPMVKKEKGTV